MLPFKRQLIRHYSTRDLKCFLAIMAIMATTAVIMLLRGQYRHQTRFIDVFHIELDNGEEDLGGQVEIPEEPSWRERVEEQRAYKVPNPLPDNTSYLKDFTSPYVNDKDGNSKSLYRGFTISKEVKKSLSGKKVITWYDVASERVREDLFDENVFDVCPVSKCKFVRPELLEEKPNKSIDAIIFPGVAGREKPPPLRSHPDQVFIYYDLDPPVRPTQAFGGSQWNSIFNWTWSYRRDSDIWEPAGTLRRADKVKPSSYFKDVAKDKNKNKHVAWFVSSCHVPSKREEYVQELQKHINVDVYGQCGNRTCPKSFECLQMLTQKYFFYLSFESALCKDYVTDKFFHMFFEDIHVVPIVMGGVDYHNFFPEGTYVDASWFPSPKQLANFLHVLMDDKKLYGEFLWRKSHFVLVGSSTTSALCQLCQRLNDLHTFRNTYPDLQNWYRSQQCRAPRKLAP